MKNKWFIALKPNEEDIFDIKDLYELPSPKGRYYADPFLYKYNDFFVYQSSLFFN